MKYYLAPLEGITGYVYRNAYHALFHPMDKYFTPFLVPTQNKKFKSREINDILPEHNMGLSLVPQILTNSAEDFIWAAEELESFGYSEINLNLGCPSGTVVAKNRGSGMLADLNLLERFFDTIFSSLSIKISVKTRIGKLSPDEFTYLLDIYNRYPLTELIIHPRIQTDFYKNKPNRAVFQNAINKSVNPVCYNGDIFTLPDYNEVCDSFPGLEQVMLGRGVIANPFLADLFDGQMKMEGHRLKEFHDVVYQGYRETISGERNVLFKMKELWFYLIYLFTEPKKYSKKIKKAETCKDYEMAVSALFHEQEIICGQIDRTFTR